MLPQDVFRQIILFEDPLDLDESFRLSLFKLVYLDNAGQPGDVINVGNCAVNFNKFPHLIENILVF